MEFLMECFRWNVTEVRNQVAGKDTMENCTSQQWEALQLLTRKILLKLSPPPVAIENYCQRRYTFLCIFARIKRG